MEPRLPSSRQWTPLPKELLKQMQSVFQEGFKGHLGGAKIEIEGRIYPQEILLSLGFSRKGQLKQPNFEISATYDVKKDNVLKLCHTVFDAMGALFDQYFSSNDESEFPLYWEELKFEGRTLYVQFSTRNTGLEAQADQLLEGKKEGLMNYDDEHDTEELENIKAKLGLGEDEDEDE